MRQQNKVSADIVAMLCDMSCIQYSLAVKYIKKRKKEKYVIWKKCEFTEIILF